MSEIITAENQKFLVTLEKNTNDISEVSQQFHGEVTMCIISKWVKQFQN